MEGIEAESGRVRPLLIAPGEPISTALRQMDESGDKILFVVDPGRHLLGVATDGDIRRWLIAGNGLDRPISEAMNASPITLRVGHAPDAAQEALVRHSIECVPVTDSDGVVVSATRWVDLFEQPRATPEQIGLPVVIMAGGEGGRLSPFTKVLPKPLIPVGGTPIVELIIERFRAHGCREFYLSVNYKANLIKAYFADLAPDYEMHYLEETAPLGTAGSLSLLRDIDSTFFVSNCDILIDADYANVLRFHRESGNAVTLVASAKNFTIPYGVCETGPQGRLTGISEKPAFDFLVSTGMYVLEPSVLDDIPGDRVFHITELINSYVEAGKAVGVYPVSEKSWLDMGQWEELNKMRSHLGLS